MVRARDSARPGRDTMYVQLRGGMANASASLTPGARGPERPALRSANTRWLSYLTGVCSIISVKGVLAYVSSPGQSLTMPWVIAERTLFRVKKGTDYHPVHASSNTSNAVDEVGGRSERSSSNVARNVGSLQWEVGCRPGAAKSNARVGILCSRNRISQISIIVWPAV